MWQSSLPWDALCISTAFARRSLKRSPLRDVHTPPQEIQDPAVGRDLVECHLDAVARGTQSAAPGSPFTLRGPSSRTRHPESFRTVPRTTPRFARNSSNPKSHPVLRTRVTSHGRPLQRNDIAALRRRNTKLGNLPYCSRLHSDTDRIRPRHTRRSTRSGHGLSRRIRSDPSYTS